jgi:hypothetical protein
VRELESEWLTGLFECIDRVKKIGSKVEYFWFLFCLCDALHNEMLS